MKNCRLQVLSEVRALREWTLMKSLFSQYEPNAMIIGSSDWLDCLVYQDQRAFYEDWINHHECILYLLKTQWGYSMGARYGSEKHEYISPHGNESRIQRFF